MTGPVICGIEDSSGAAGAIHLARELADVYGLPLLYVHVVDGSGGVERASETLRDCGASGSGLVLERGHPADRLVDLAVERGASFLVLGNHGPRSSLLGSISADVSRRAPCPVIVVPPTARRGRARGRMFLRPPAREKAIVTAQ